MPLQDHRTLLLVVFSVVLPACGGGGSGGSGGSGGPPPPPPASISYSATNFSFTAAAPYSGAPPSQTLSATVSGVTSGTLYITVVENSPDVVTVQNIQVTSKTAGQATIVPGNPAQLLTGNHQGTFVVSACLNDPTCNTGQLSGSPQTITVHYDIGSNVVADTVTPRVVPANLSGTVILRGHGFASGQTVTLGSTPIPASSISYFGESQLTISYPALAAGSYPISINSGSVSYQASLTVVDPTAYPSILLPYPGISPTAIQSLEYDAQRNALLVLAATSTQPVLLRYAFDGTNWSTPAQVSIASLQQVHLSADGTRVLGLISPDTQQASIIELDPVTLSQTANTPLPTSVATIVPGNPHNAGFSLANDGNAIVVLEAYSIMGAVPGGLYTFDFIFDTANRTFSVLPLPVPTGIGPLTVVPISSADGNLVEFGWEYNASGGTAVTNLNFPLGGLGASDDLVGDKVVLPYEPSIGAAVFNSGSGSVLGRLPVTQGSVINRNGTRVYLIEGTQVDPLPRLHIFDVTTSPGPNSQYPELAPALSLAGDPGVGSPVAPLLEISVDAGTVFVAGANGVAVQPVPP